MPGPEERRQKNIEVIREYLRSAFADPVTGPAESQKSPVDFVRFDVEIPEGSFRLWVHDDFLRFEERTANVLTRGKIADRLRSVGSKRSVTILPRSIVDNPIRGHAE